MPSAKTGTVLALDPGTKNIGLAVSDPDRTMAFPASVVSAKRETLLPELKKLIAERGITQLVVGSPAALSGSPIPMTQKAKEFAEWLERELQIPVELVDERLSTVAARQVSTADKVDATAAAFFLETYLERSRRQNAKKPA